MATTRQRVDKNTFKQICRDHWEPFQQRQPRYQDRYVQAVIEKMLSCGTPEAGYTTYRCPHCLVRTLFWGGLCYERFLRSLFSLTAILTHLTCGPEDMEAY